MSEDRIAVRIPEACRMIGIRRSKLYELMDSGDLETIKIGVSRLVLVSSLQAFVEARRSQERGLPDAARRPALR